MQKAVMDYEKCTKEYLEIGCAFVCIEACTGAVEMWNTVIPGVSEGFEPLAIPVVMFSKCTGCGECVPECPEQAITLVEIEALKKAGQIKL